jgi:hypothetical protein
MLRSAPVVAAAIHAVVLEARGNALGFGFTLCVGMSLAATNSGAHIPRISRRRCSRRLRRPFTMPAN